MKPFISITQALKHIKNGRPLIVLDSAQRENEGDFFLPAQKATPKIINLFLTQGRGLLNTALSAERAAALNIWPMLPAGQNTEKTRVNMAVSMDAKRGITTGASVFDRVKTINLLGNPKATADDFTQPGHVFPLIAHPQGLKTRAGHTEAAVALCQMAKVAPAGVLCEILDAQGKMARLPYLKNLGKKFNIPMIKISRLKAAARQKPDGNRAPKPEELIIQTARAKLPTAFGLFEILIFRTPLDGLEHAALINTNKTSRLPLVRVHSQCLTGDTLFSLRCDCGGQLKKSLAMIAQAGGALIYLNQEGRGIGLSNKIKAYALQDTQGLDTIQANCALGLPADARSFTTAAGILRRLKMTKVRLLTNNPEKIHQLKKFGVRIAKRVPLEIPANPANARYLLTKKNKLGHYLKIDEQTKPRG